MADYKHFLLRDTAVSKDYTPVPSGGGPKVSPPRPNRTLHGPNLLTGLERARQHIEHDISALPMAQGLRMVPMEFDEHQQFDMMIDQLERDRLGIRILNARSINDRVKFTVAVPYESLAEFANYIKRAEAVVQDDRKWDLGETMMTRGSIHSDAWTVHEA